MTTMSTDTTTPITLPLGTGPAGTDVRWALTDEHGHPRHGLIVGPTGSGGSTALARLATGAHAAGVRPSIIALEYGTDYLDPAWDQAPWNAAWCVDADELIGDTEELLAHAGPAPAPRLVLVDGGMALRCAPHLWERLLEQADRLRVSVVVRVYAPTAGEMGTGVVRDLLLARGQYLALGRSLGTTAAVAQDLLAGYTPPVGRQAPGAGVYGHQGRVAPVNVTAPNA